VDTDATRRRTRDSFAAIRTSSMSASAARIRSPDGTKVDVLSRPVGGQEGRTIPNDIYVDLVRQHAEHRSANSADLLFWYFGFDTIRATTDIA